MPEKIYPISVTPGIQRDGTQFSSGSWIDGEWCRFYRGLPKKMGGYVKIGGIPNIIRGTYVVPTSPNFNVYLGDFKHLHYYSIDSSGTIIAGPLRRTPVPFSASPYNLWSFDIMHSTVSDSSILIAHAAQNLYSIDSNTNGEIFYGDTYGNAPLVGSGVEVSGGIVVLHPNLFAFGNNGEVIIFSPNSTTDIINTARVTGQKIVAGLPTRGGSNSPAGLLWSLDSVIRVTFVGPQAGDFNFDTISSQSSILSSKSVIEHDSFYYWIGSDRFLYYDGTVRELPNQTNSEYFFNRIDYSQRQKVWATKIPRRGEIIWHYVSIHSPNGECDSTIIYNIREKCWYDASISRSSGYFDQTFTYPIWTDSSQNIGVLKWVTIEGQNWNVLQVQSWALWNVGEQYSIWLHEKGVDKDIGFLAWANIDEIWNEVQANSWANWSSGVLPIRSNIESRIISLASYDPNNQRQDLDVVLDLERIEPDFKQKGKMSLTIRGKKYANSPEFVSKPYVFYGTDSIIPPPTEKIDLREQRRQMTLKFESNVIGGDYEMGQVLMVSRVGDVRP
jgi:hypothetical protein